MNFTPRPAENPSAKPTGNVSVKANPARAQDIKGQALVILGSPRSGTSVSVNAFRLLGFFLGDEEDFPAPKDGNPAGIYERQEMLALNNHALDALYLGHERPVLNSIDQHPAFPRLVQEAIEVYKKVFGGFELWGWKDPKTTFIAPIHRAALTQSGVIPSFLICVRRPSEVIVSQKKIYDASESKKEAPIGIRAYRRWMNYTIQALAHSQGALRALVVYHQLLENPRRTLEAAHRSILPGRDFDMTAMDGAVASIRQDLHRNKAQEDVPADAPAIMRELWDLCCEIGENPEAFQTGDFDSSIAGLGHEIQQLETVFSEPLPPYGRVSLLIPGKESVEADFLPSNGWNKIELEVPAEAGAKLLGSLYPMPANVFVRNARWDNEAAQIKGVNDTEEGREGSALRFSIGFSNPQVCILTPNRPGPHHLSMEIYVEMNVFTALEALLRQTRRTISFQEQARSLTEHSGRMETQIMHLQREIMALKVQAQVNDSRRNN